MQRGIACGVVSFCKWQVRMISDANCMRVSLNRSAKVEIGMLKATPTY